TAHRPRRAGRARRRAALLGAGDRAAARRTAARRGGGGPAGAVGRAAGDPDLRPADLAPPRPSAVRGACAAGGENLRRRPGHAAPAGRSGGAAPAGHPGPGRRAGRAAGASAAAGHPCRPAPRRPVRHLAAAGAGGAESAHRRHHPVAHRRGRQALRPGAAPAAGGSRSGHARRHPDRHAGRRGAAALARRPRAPRRPGADPAREPAPPRRRVGLRGRRPLRRGGARRAAGAGGPAAAAGLRAAGGRGAPGPGRRVAAHRRAGGPVAAADAGAAAGALPLAAAEPDRAGHGAAGDDRRRRRAGVDRHAAVRGQPGRLRRPGRHRRAQRHPQAEPLSATGARGRAAGRRADPARLGRAHDAGADDRADRRRRAGAAARRRRRAGQGGAAPGGAGDLRRPARRHLPRQLRHAAAVQALRPGRVAAQLNRALRRLARQGLCTGAKGLKTGNSRAGSPAIVLTPRVRAGTRPAERREAACAACAAGPLNTRDTMLRSISMTSHSRQRTRASTRPWGRWLATATAAALLGVAGAAAAQSGSLGGLGTVVGDVAGGDGLLNDVTGTATNLVGSVGGALTGAGSRAGTAAAGAPPAINKYTGQVIPNGAVLLVWTGDGCSTPLCDPRTSQDFLAVVDAEPNSTTYGNVIWTAELPNILASNVAGNIVGVLGSDSHNDPHHMLSYTSYISGGGDGLAKGHKYTFAGGVISKNVFRFDITSVRNVGKADIAVCGTQPRRSSLTDDFIVMPAPGPNHKILYTYMSNYVYGPGGTVTEIDPDRAAPTVAGLCIASLPAPVPLLQSAEQGGILGSLLAGVDVADDNAL